MVKINVIAYRVYFLQLKILWFVQQLLTRSQSLQKINFNLDFIKIVKLFDLTNLENDLILILILSVKLETYFIPVVVSSLEGSVDDASVTEDVLVTETSS